jgi:hypothetical protein
MMKPMKKSGDMSAIDELMGESSEHETAEDEGAEEVAEAKPKGDPAEILASIQSQLDELSLLLG